MSLHYLVKLKMFIAHLLPLGNLARGTRITTNELLENETP